MLGVQLPLLSYLFEHSAGVRSKNMKGVEIVSKYKY
jgi:hypothetical protein